MSVETFLEGVRAELAADLGIDVVAGFIEGPLEGIPDAGYGCVFPEQTEEVVTDVMWEDVTLRARVFLPIAQVMVPEQPIDTSDLLQVRTRMIAALADKQTEQWGVWFFRVQGFVFDPPRRFVEAVIVGRQRAEFTAGA